MAILVHHLVAILLAKMLIWAPFSQSTSTLSFCINLWFVIFNTLQYWSRSDAGCLPNQGSHFP